MPPRELFVDPATLDFSQVLFDLDAIRALNPQRFEFEQVTAVIHCDREQGVVVGYKDYAPDEMWIRGHMPGTPILPGVLMCETAAQLASFFVQKFGLLGADMVGLGGLEEVRFRGIVRPTDRLVMLLKLTKSRAGKMVTCRFQGLVGSSLVCEGGILGIPLNRSMLG